MGSGHPDLLEQLRVAVGRCGERVGHLDETRHVLEGDPGPVGCHAAARPDVELAVVYLEGLEGIERRQVVVVEAVYFARVADVVDEKMELEERQSLVVGSGGARG